MSALAAAVSVACRANGLRTALAARAFFASATPQNIEPASRAELGRAGLRTDEITAVVARIAAVGRVADPFIPVHFAAGGTAG